MKRIFSGRLNADIRTMTANEENTYERIAKAISFINTHFREQPDLSRIAESAGLSPLHFQKVFTAWAGTSPKQFLHYVSSRYARQLLKERQLTLFDTALETGLSSASRLHELFIKIEAMSPAEYKKGAIDLDIKYSFAQTRFGEILVASTAKGVCRLSFEDDRQEGTCKLRREYPRARLTEGTDEHQQQALRFFLDDWSSLADVKLHLRGTCFQLKVWQALLEIPMGRLSSYGEIALRIEQPAASRAVGTAIGSNPIAFLIPCHRVIRSSGNFGGYMWGIDRKTAMIGWEAASMQASGKIIT